MAAHSVRRRRERTWCSTIKQRSFIRVSEPRHYAIVELPEFGQHDLKLASNSDNFAIFALTFGSYLEGA